MPHLLTDEEVRQYITDGCIALTPDVEPSLHTSIDESVRFAIEREFPMGNNVVSRVPDLWKVLRSDRIHGALVSLLGPNYYVHPHRAVHTSRPVEDKNVSYTPDFNGPPMGKGSMAGSGWHQDAQSPLSRARHHTPKYLIGFYFPHRTPEIMGPTRYQAGSYLFSEPTAPTGVVLPDCVEAGTFLLLHFDTVHAGWPNRTDTARYMIKFVFTRTEHPKVATWQNQTDGWRIPEQYRADADVNVAWEYLWHWMRGRIDQRNSVPADLDSLNSPDQTKRLNAIYATENSNHVAELVAKIHNLAESGMQRRRLAKDREGNFIPRDDVRRGERRWNERAIVMDDAAYALGALGEAAKPAIESLLKETDPWILINSVFSCGEIGPEASSLIPRLVELLRNPNQEVVRQTLDAIGSIGRNMDIAMDDIERLLTNSNPDWHSPQVMRGWHGEDQVRLNAAFALLSAINYDNDLDRIESILSKCLGDSNGYVSAVAVEALTRLGTPTSQALAIQFLQDRRWDDRLKGRIKPF